MKRIWLGFFLVGCMSLAWADNSTVAPVVNAVPTMPAAAPAPTAMPTATVQPNGLLSAPISAPQPAAPAQIPLVTQVEVPVIDESPNALQLGLQAAFSEAMVKSTGNPDVMKLESVQIVSKNITQIVQSYSFNQKTAPLPPAKPDVSLTVVFNQNAMTQLVQLVSKQTNTVSSTQVVMPAKVTLLVTGIKNMNDYDALMTALRQTKGVADVSVNNVDPDRVSVTVNVTGGAPALNSALVANTHFKPLSANTMNNQNQLFYVWVDQP